MELCHSGEERKIQILVWRRLGGGPHTIDYQGNFYKKPGILYYCCFICSKSFPPHTFPFSAPCNKRLDHPNY